MVCCDWCGPRSLRPNAARFEVAECGLSRNACEVADIDRYIKCDCGMVWSAECLDSVASLAEVAVSKREAAGGGGRFELDDEKGVWRALMRRPWRRSEGGALFVDRTAHQPARLNRCIICEDYSLREPEARLPTEFVKNKKPDGDAPITIPVLFSPLLPTGERGDPIILALEEHAWYPLVAAEDCKRVFKGGRGTREEYGGMLAGLGLAMFNPSLQI